MATQVIPPPPDPMPKAKALTQHQKILAMMCSDPSKKWWRASDFQKPGVDGLFVGYEATARLSELDGDNPGLFERRKNDRFVERRVCFETGKEWYPTLSKDLQLMVKRYYKS